jgi:hypothetical protein
MTVRNQFGPRPRPWPHARLHVIGADVWTWTNSRARLAITHRNQVEGANAMNTNTARAVTTARKPTTHLPERP